MAILISTIIKNSGNNDNNDDNGNNERTIIMNKMRIPVIIGIIKIMGIMNTSARLARVIVVHNCVLLECVSCIFCKRQLWDDDHTGNDDGNCNNDKNRC